METLLRFDLEDHAAARICPAEGSSPVEVACRIADHAAERFEPIGLTREAAERCLVPGWIQLVNDARVG
jgi:hypothetical protein